MKNKDIEGEEKEGEGEEKPEEEDEKADEEEKRLGKILEKSTENILKAIRENPVGKSFFYHKEDASVEKSVLEQDQHIRRLRPFVKLSKKMEDFVEDLRVMAVGGFPKSLKKALSEGDDTAGGFLVPEEFSSEVYRHVSEQAVIRPRARVFSMARDILTLPRIVQTTNDFGGVSLSWLAEAGTKTTTDPVFGRITLKVNKLIGMTYVSDELLADSAVNLANFLVSLFGDAISYEEDKQFIQGTGVGKPLGIISSATKIARQTSTRIKIEDVFGLYRQLPVWATSNAVWLMNKPGLEQIMLIAVESETTQSQLFLPSMRDKIPFTLLGHDVLLTEKVKALGTAGDIIFGDLSKYWIGDREGLAVTSSIHNRFETDETTLRFVKRVDGQPAEGTAFRILHE